jgi:hypothetical protein
MFFHYLAAERPDFVKKKNNKTMNVPQRSPLWEEAEASLRRIYAVF